MAGASLLGWVVALGIAQAADDGVARPEGTDCSENAVPIAGSAGFANARHAFRTTSQTYAATNYAERNLFKHTASDETTGDASYEFFQMINAASVPTREDRAGTTPLCPRAYAVSVRPVDIQAVAMGAAIHKGPWGGFYAASVAYGNTAMPNNLVRGQILFGQPLYAATTLALAPLARNGLRTQEGASSFALDWVAGATYTHELFGIRAGYAGSRGLYANIVDNKLGFFASGLLGGADRGDGILSYVRTGLDRMALGKLLDGAGLTSLYYRDIPFGPQPSEAATQGDVDQGGRLRTVHFAQQNIGRRIDIEAAYATRPTNILQHGIVGIHTPRFVTGRLGGGPPEGFIWNVRGGIVNVPDPAVYGLEESQYLSLRADLGASFGENDDVLQGGRFGGSLLFNDPELLALYPYAVNAVTVRLHVDWTF